MYVCWPFAVSVASQLDFCAGAAVARRGGDGDAGAPQPVGKMGDLHRSLAVVVRVAVEARAMPHPASAVAPHVTVSIGVATALPDAARAPEWLVASADRAMYAAKLQGRNRVCAGFADP